jgi:DNA-binding HxlR family transcriptional regulator
MSTYGQFCPLAQATQLLCERWTLLVVREMIAGSTRFSELQRGVPLMSPTLLSTRLKMLVKAGVIRQSGNKGNYTYSLTEAGLELRPVVELLGAWGHRWSPSNLNPGDLDAGLLMWDMRRTVDPAVFPKHRIVVQFEYPDAPQGSRDWWLVSENGEIELCLSDHGFDVDVLIKCPLKKMTEVWISQQRFADAVKKGDIKVLGDLKLANKLQDWLRGSPLSKLGSLGKLPELNWANQ